MTALQEELVLDVQAMKKNIFRSKKGFFQKTVGYVKAVDDVKFYIRPGETFGLVGESGCGKTTLGRCVLRAVEPSSGAVMFRDRQGNVRNVLNLEPKEMRAIRRDMQLIFQDPYSSLNPRMTVLNIIAEPLVCNGMMSGRELKDRVRHLMELVGSTAAISSATRTPSAEGSGSGSASPGHWRPNRSSSYAMKPYPRWMCPYRRRSSTCCRIYRKSSI